MLQVLLQDLVKSKPCIPQLPVSFRIGLQAVRSAWNAAEIQQQSDAKYHFGVVGSGPAGFYTANFVSWRQECALSQHHVWRLE